MAVFAKPSAHKSGSATSCGNRRNSSAGRAAFAALGLLVYVVAVERRGTLRAFRAHGLSGLAVVALIAVSSASFIAALNHASVANVLFWMALAPILAAGLGTLVGDPVDRKTWAAMAIALVGVGVMVGGPGHPSALGQLLSLTMSASFAGILVITGIAARSRWLRRRSWRSSFS